MATNPPAVLPTHYLRDDILGIPANILMTMQNDLSSKYYLQNCPYSSLNLSTKSLQNFRLWRTASGPWVMASLSTVILRSLFASSRSRKSEKLSLFYYCQTLIKFSQYFSHRFVHFHRFIELRYRVPWFCPTVCPALHLPFSTGCSGQNASFVWKL